MAVDVHQAREKEFPGEALHVGPWRRRTGGEQHPVRGHLHGRAPQKLCVPEDGVREEPSGGGHKGLDSLPSVRSKPFASTIRTTAKVSGRATASRGCRTPLPPGG